MGMSQTQLIEYVIAPTLRYLTPEIPYSLGALRLVVGTGKIESGDWTFVDQLSRGPGPGYGLFQTEALTLQDRITWLAHPSRASLQAKVAAISGAWPLGPLALEGNLWLATAFCRIHYRALPDPIPAADDAQGLARLYKVKYNTAAGATTWEKALDTFTEMVLTVGECDG